MILILLKFIAILGTIRVKVHEPWYIVYLATSLTKPLTNEHAHYLYRQIK